MSRRPPSAGAEPTDYLYVISDSTAPAGGAGPDQTVPIGRRVVFVTQAHDTNGLAAVRFRFTASGNGVGQPVNQLGQPFRHVFTKLGIYAVTVTITDLAGNTTTDRAIVRVVRGVTSTVSGRWPARATRRAGIKTKLSARIPGDLSLQLIRPNGRVAVARTVSFDKARVGKQVAIALKRLPRRPLPRRTPVRRRQRGCRASRGHAARHRLTSEVRLSGGSRRHWRGAQGPHRPPPPRRRSRPR